MQYYVRDLILLCVLIFSAVDARLQAQENILSDKDIKEILDSAYIIHGLQDYQVLVRYLEKLDPEKIENDTLALRYYYRSSIAYSQLDWHELRFETVIKGLLLAQKLDSQWMLQALYRELGSFHNERFHDSENALIYMKRATNHMDGIDSLAKTGLMMDIALTSVSANQLDSAKSYYQKAFSYLPPYDEVMRSDVYSFYAPYLLKTNQLDSAQYYLEYTSKFWKKYGFNQGLTESYITLAELHFKRSDFKKSIEYATSALSLADELNNIDYASSALSWKAQSEDAMSLEEESLQSYRLLNEIKDSIARRRQKSTIDEKRIEFLLSQYKDDLEQINNHNETLKSQMSLNRKLMYSSLLLVPILGIFFWVGHRKRQSRIATLNLALENAKKKVETLKEEHRQIISELEKNKRELTSTALFIEKKDETLKSVRKLLSQIVENSSPEVQEKITSAKKLADSSIRINSNWESFRFFFEQLFPSFASQIRTRHPSLNQNDIRILSYIKMGLTDKECARLTGINTASFQKAKYRLKKKMNLQKDIGISEILDAIEKSD